MTRATPQTDHLRYALRPGWKAHQQHTAAHRTYSRKSIAADREHPALLHPKMHGRRHRSSTPQASKSSREHKRQKDAGFFPQTLRQPHYPCNYPGCQRTTRLHPCVLGCCALRKGRSSEMSLLRATLSLHRVCSRYDIFPRCPSRQRDWKRYCRSCWRRSMEFAKQLVFSCHLILMYNPINMLENRMPNSRTSNAHFLVFPLILYSVSQRYSESVSKK